MVLLHVWWHTAQVPWYRSRFKMLVNLLWLPWCVQPYLIVYAYVCTYLSNFPIGFLHTEKFVEGSQEVTASEHQKGSIQIYMHKSW